MENLTEAARTALIDAGTNRRGATTVCTPVVLVELQDAGLLGRDGGLTRKGSIVRERIMNEALREAFGE